MRALALTAAIGVSLLPAAPAAGAAATARPCGGVAAAAAGLGRLAFLDAGRLRVFDLRDCRLRTLVARGASAPLHWSADGRYLGFGAGAVVPAQGGRVTYPLGALSAGVETGSPDWVWAPSGHRLAGLSTSGSVVVGAPGSAPRTLLPPGWGATGLAFAPGGSTLAVSRAHYQGGARPSEQQVWLLGIGSRSRREIFQVPAGQVAPPWLYGFSPDGSWVVAWLDSQSSSSLAADGLPLIAIPMTGGPDRRFGAGTLVDGDFLSWCGVRLAYVLNRGGREVTLGDRIALAGPPPGWRVSQPAAVAPGRRLSFISPACAPTGAGVIAAAVGPETPDDPLGQERRRIWLLEGRRRPLEPPPPFGSSDELPTWSPSGRLIAFVRTRWLPARGVGAGQLYLLELGARPGSAARLVGPLVGLGTTSNEDGHYGWEGQLAWAEG